MKRWTLAAVTAITATVALAVPVAASASTPPPTPTTTPAPGPSVPPRLRLACARVPNTTERVNRSIARLEADASTRGSLAWLQAQIDKATAAGQTERATVLQNRYDVRAAKLELLKARATSLQEIADRCSEHGL